MEFRTFVARLMRIRWQIIRTGRNLVYRLPAWNAWQGVVLRLASQLCRPLRWWKGSFSKPESRRSRFPVGDRERDFAVVAPRSIRWGAIEQEAGDLARVIPVADPIKRLPFFRRQHQEIHG
jgi:hypothetical protein